MSMTFDEFVASNIPTEHHNIVRKLRELIRQCAPNAKEAVSYNMPVWIGDKNIFAYINHNQTGITFSFVRGVEFEDKYGLLRGRAKHARHVKIQPQTTVNDDALCDYIRQALEWESR